MRSAGMPISAIIDEIAAVGCEPPHIRTFTRGINAVSDAAPTTRRAAAAIYARNPIDYELLLSEMIRP
jgi:hypothetical protein